MSYSEYPEFDDYQRRLNPTGSHTSLTTVILGSAVAVYSFFKTLEFIGYPVWLWLHSLTRMATGVLRLTGASLDSSSDSSDNTMQRSGGMLGSIFGLNPGSLLHKGVRGVAGALSRGPSETPPGLGNMSNSCYQNSVIQGLASLPSVREYLAKMTTEHPSFTTDTMNGALHDMLSKLNDPNNVGQNFWIRGKLKSMSVYQQQDAQEYYSKVLDALDEEVKKASSSKRRSSVSWLEATKSLNDLPVAAGDAQATDESEGDVKTAQATIEQPKIVPNPLDGLQAQRVGCMSCGYSEGLNLTPFNCLTVALGNNSSYDIRECLDELTKMEYIEGVECAKCTLLRLKGTLTPLAISKPDAFAARLNAVQEALDDEDFEDKTLIKTLSLPKKNWSKSTKSKQIVIARAPKSLVLHVNRSSFDANTFMPYKNSAGVFYPKVLDLGKWCLGNSPSGSQHPDMSLEEWPRDPKESMLADSQDKKLPSSSFQYRLRAAVTHYGSHGSGHYVCYRPHARVIRQTEPSGEVDTETVQESPEEQWWRFSDDSVYTISESEASQVNVFMLFYERIDEPVSVLPQVPPTLTEVTAIAEDAPLPPADVTIAEFSVDEDNAAGIPLPAEDDLLDTDPFDLPVLDPSLSGPIPQSSQDHAPLVLSAAHGSVTQENHPELPNQDADTELDTEMSEAESEDAPSTLFTSDYESEADIPAPPTPKVVPIPPVSPHLMRTAGNTVARRQGSRQSLPLVSAT